MIAFLVFVVIIGFGLYALANYLRSPDYQNRLMEHLGKAVAARR